MPGDIMFSDTVLERGREAGVPESEIHHYHNCVFSKLAYLVPDSAIESCIKSFTTDGHPTEIKLGERHPKSGTRAPALKR